MAKTIRKNAGFTLLEMVLSLSVMSLAFAAVGSVFILASHVMPSPGTAEASTVAQSAALSRLIEDLQVARYITESSATSVTMVVDDRTGDGLPDRLRYAWSGNAGDPLTLSINGSTPIKVATNVQAFSLSFTTEDRVDSIAGGSVVSDEVLLFAHTNATSSQFVQIRSNQWCGQLIQPQLPVEAIDYTITRLRLVGQSYGNTNQEFSLRLRGVDGTLPNDTIYAEQLVKETDLPSSIGWFDIAIESPISISAATLVAMTLEGDDGAGSYGDIYFDSAGGSGYLTAGGAGATWTHSATQGMRIEVFGTTTTITPDVTLTRQVRVAARVTLQVGSAKAQTADTKLYREPGVHSAQWDAGFDASPVGVDMDGHGADWKVQTGGASSTFAEGRWTVDGLLYTNPSNNFDQPMVVDLVMGATAASRGGANFQINVDQVGGLAIPITVRVGRDSAGQHFVNVYDTASLATARLSISDLGDNLPNIRLIIAPGDNAVGVFVNAAAVESFYYTPVSASGLPGIASLSEAVDGIFDEVSIRVGGTAVVTAGAVNAP